MLAIAYRASITDAPLESILLVAQPSYHPRVYSGMMRPVDSISFHYTILTLILTFLGQHFWQIAGYSIVQYPF